MKRTDEEGVWRMPNSRAEPIGSRRELSYASMKLGLQIFANAVSIYPQLNVGLSNLGM